MREENKKLFYYFDGIKGTIVSKGSHPSGMIGSPITLFNNIGVFYKDGNEDVPISFCGMKSVDSLNYVKFDILGLKAVGVIQDTYKLLGRKWEYAHEINWNDENVWNDMLKSSVGIFQFEGDFAFDLLSQFKPQAINDMSLVNASLRPSGKSYRNRLIGREFNRNPSDIIDKLLEANKGFLVFQEDTIAFLQEICGFSGSLADTTRRCIGKKDLVGLKEQLPKILEGYCSKSNQPREIAEKEVKEFIQIISDSSEYQFGLNHSTGYSMNGYMGARLRYYYPLEYTTAYLNNADNEEDIISGTLLASQYNIKVNPPKFRYSKAEYMFDKTNNSIYKGISSIKFLNETISNELYNNYKNTNVTSFIELVHKLKLETSIDFRQLKILTMLNYFSEYGKNQKLLTLVELYEKKLKNKKLKDTTIEKRLIELKETELATKDKSLNIKDQIKAEKEYMGYEMTTTDKVPDNVYIVTEIDVKYCPKLRLYNLNTGKVEYIKCKRADIKKNPFGEFSVIKKECIRRQVKNKPDSNGEWKPTDEFDIYLTKWEVII